MSIDIQLRQLSLEQLVYAREQADRLLNEKMAEPKVLLWMVSNESIVLGYFIESDYLRAVQSLVECAAKLAAEDDVRIYKKKLSIDTIRVPASEVESYLRAAC